MYYVRLEDAMQYFQPSPTYAKGRARRHRMCARVRNQQECVSNGAVFYTYLPLQTTTTITTFTVNTSYYCTSNHHVITHRYGTDAGPAGIGVYQTPAVRGLDSIESPHILTSARLSERFEFCNLFYAKTCFIHHATKNGAPIRECVFSFDFPAECFLFFFAFPI